MLSLHREQVSRVKGATMTDSIPLPVKPLAEAIIMQAIEDLWDDKHRGESIDFFKGRGFRYCARMAEMGSFEQAVLLQILGHAPGGAGG